MTWQHTARSRRDYQTAPASVQRAFEKQIRLLTENLRHPSLRSKKYDEASGLWQARVNRSWRFYFTVAEDVYTIITIIPHPK